MFQAYQQVHKQQRTQVNLYSLAVSRLAAVLVNYLSSQGDSKNKHKKVNITPQAFLPFDPEIDTTDSTSRSMTHQTAVVIRKLLKEDKLSKKVLASLASAGVLKTISELLD